MTKASDLLEQGRQDEVWRQYAGFLDLTLPEFMNIQERLLVEQLGRIAKSPLGKAMLDGEVPDSAASFREHVPLKTYEDYATWFDERREDVLPEKPVAWAHTSGRSGKHKWAPYAPAFAHKIGEVALSAVMLAASHRRGDVRIQKGDVFVYNTPPRPYTSAQMVHGLAEWFDFKMIPPPEIAEGLSFQERVELSFRMALRTGMDVAASLSSVMLRLGERFAQGGSTMSFSRDLLHPMVITRLVRALIRSKLQNRPLLPRDLWTLKGVVVSGTDTSIYRAKLLEYWGIEPHEVYGCTEGGVLGSQAWDRRGMYFFPDVAFLEFIPEEEWERSRQDPNYVPRTVLIDEVKPGCLYEVVITNLNDGPFMRYRMYDLVVFTPLGEREPSIPMPSFYFKSRTTDLIDLAGFSGLIDEKSMWQALLTIGLELEEWSVRKEVEETRPILHTYVEFREPADATEVHRRLDEALRASNPSYADIQGILGYDPLRVTLLPRGTFAKYLRCQQAAGADLSHLKPPHLNAQDRLIDQLIACARE